MIRYFICIACIAMMAVSCSNGSSSLLTNDSTSIDTTGTNSLSQTNADTPLKINISVPITPNSGGTANEDWNRKIIKTANINIELKDYNSFNNRIHAGLRSYGAYVSAEDQESNDGKIENKLTIKVPVDQFEDLINSLDGEGVKISQKNITSEDVTGEVIDTKARLETKKEIRYKYAELLKNANNEKTLLAAESNIDNAQQDVESSQSRINYLQHGTAYSTINRDYYQLLTVEAANTVSPSFLSKLHAAFSTGTSFVSELILFFTSIWPLMIGLLILFFFLRQVKNKHANNKAA